MIEGLGKRLQRLRMREGFTQKEAAAIPEIECDASVLATYETGYRSPKLETLVRFAQFYGVSTDYLLGLSEYETPDQIATSAAIPLTNDALNYLRTCDKQQLITLSLILSARSADEFLDALRGYIEDSDIRDPDGQIGAKYHALSEAFGQHMTDKQFASFVERWAWDSLEKATAQIAKEIHEDRDLEDGGTRIGRPKKYKTKKTAAQASRPWKKPPEGKG